MSYMANGRSTVLSNGDLIRHQRDHLSRRTDPNNSRSAANERLPQTLSSNQEASDYPIIVHSHLCWDWVWQRPQQFVSRLSGRHKILFVETVGPDPQLSSPLARFSTPEKFPNITVLRIQFPAWRWNDGAYVDRTRRRLVKEFIGGPASGQFMNPVQWFYDPMTVSAFAGRLGERLIVYDCMDELSKFRYAPPELAQREAELLAQADVVFVGGRRLFEAKRKANGNCHFYGCGADVEHFGRARHPDTPVPAEIAALPKPVLGYFGVVDERLDYELLLKLARANPSCSIAMIGPVLKIEATSLPAAPNLHWLGQRAYADLPACCKGFDVCLMPFALNEATEFINPTKALEYMAAGKPVVSSAVPDVVRNFSSVIKIARSHEEFISLCGRAIDCPDEPAIEQGLAMAAGNSWESIVSKLENHVEAALRSRLAAEVNA